MALVPEHPDQPPGARNLVRILTERLHAGGEALVTGDDLVARLTPRHWSGTANDEFIDTAVPKIDTEWQKIATINQSATARVEGYSTFLHNLPKLWLMYIDDPAELDRLRLLWDEESRKLATELMAWAAELDNLGHVDIPDPALSAVPADLAEPVPDRPEAGPVAPDSEHSAMAPPAARPGQQQAVAEYTQSLLVASRLREQMLAGERRDHIPWIG